MDGYDKLLGDICDIVDQVVEIDYFGTSKVRIPLV